MSSGAGDHSAYHPLAGSKDPSQQTLPATASAIASTYPPLVTSTRSSPQDNKIASDSTAGVSRPAASRHGTSATISGVIGTLGYKLDNGVLFIDGKTLPTSSPTTVTLHDSEILKIDPTGAILLHVPPVNTSDVGSNGRVDEIRTVGVTPRQYFIGAFLPTLLAVCFSIPLYLLASALQEMEPFYQLQRPEGTSAANSILLNYQNAISVVATFNAMVRGHFSVWGSGLISLAVLLLVPLASETVYIGFVGQSVCTATSGRIACTPRLGVHLTTARVVQGILVIIAALILALMITTARKPSGVYSNPLSIASVAVLFQDQELIDEVRQLDPYGTDPRILKTALQGQGYRIGSYNNSHGGRSYGLTTCYSSASSHEMDGYTQKYRGKKYTSVAGTSAREDTSARPKAKAWMLSATLLTQPVGVAIFALLVAGLETVVIYYDNTGGDTGFERFMDSQSFGVTFLFTALGVGIKLYWTLLDDGKNSPPC